MFKLADKAHANTGQCRELFLREPLLLALLPDQLAERLVGVDRVHNHPFRDDFSRFAAQMHEKEPFGTINDCNALG